MRSSPGATSEIYEWMAISQTVLGFPPEMVRASFENAIRHDPSNDRAKANLAAFEAKNPGARNWDIPTATAVRTWGLAERRCQIGAWPDTTSAEPAALAGNVGHDMGFATVQ